MDQQDTNRSQHINQLLFVYLEGYFIVNRAGIMFCTAAGLKYT